MTENDFGCVIFFLELPSMKVEETHPGGRDPT